MSARPARAGHVGLAPRNLAPPGMVAAMLAFAGLPLYVHAPRYFAEVIGVDLALTPAMLAARIRDGGAQVFSVWTFLQKSALAVGAGVSLTALGMAGYEPGTTDEDALGALTAGYALAPCALKLLAMAALWLFVNDRGD